MFVLDSSLSLASRRLPQDVDHTLNNIDNNNYIKSSNNKNNKNHRSQHNNKFNNHDEPKTMMSCPRDETVTLRQLGSGDDASWLDQEKIFFTETSDTGTLNSK